MKKITQCGHGNIKVETIGNKHIARCTDCEYSVHDDSEGLDVISNEDYAILEDLSLQEAEDINMDLYITPDFYAETADGYCPLHFEIATSIMRDL